LAHHVVVQISAQRIGLPLKDLKYRILGDDIVIMDRQLASSYLDVMTELGVSISPTKTHTGENLFEFAKRFGYKGSEITQFPITSIVEHLTVYSLVAQGLESARERGFLPLFIQSNSPDFWNDLVKITHPKANRLQIYLINKMRQFHLLPSSSKPIMSQIQDLKTLAWESFKIDDFSVIDKALLDANIEIREREIDKLTSKKFKYNMVIQGLLGSIMFFIPWDQVSVTHREYLPVISSLDKSTRLKLDTLVNVRELTSGIEVSKALETDPIKPVPQLKGLQPVRPNEVIARSRSALLKPFLNKLREEKEKSTLKQTTPLK